MSWRLQLLAEISPELTDDQHHGVLLYPVDECLPHLYCVISSYFFYHDHSIIDDVHLTWHCFSRYEV